jgi:hypothetical protein
VIEPVPVVRRSRTEVDTLLRAVAHVADRILAVRKDVDVGHAAKGVQIAGTHSGALKGVGRRPFIRQRGVGTSVVDGDRRVNDVREEPTRELTGHVHNARQLGDGAVAALHYALELRDIGHPV